MNKPRTKQLDWVKILTNEARLTDVILVDQIAATYKVPIATVWRAVSRLTKRGLLSRVANGVYLNKFVRDASALDFVGVLKPTAYVSLESALNRVRDRFSHTRK